MECSSEGQPRAVAFRHVRRRSSLPRLKAPGPLAGSPPAWALAAVGTATALAACGQGDPQPLRPDVSPAARPVGAPEDALRAAAQAQADASVRGDTAQLAGFASPRCTGEERERLAAAAALPREVVGRGRVVVDIVRVDGVFGGVTYAFGGEAPPGFREAFEAADAGVDYWELIDGAWYRVDPEACRGDAAAARPAPAAPTPAPTPDPDLSGAWALESLELYDDPHGDFAGRLTLRHLDPAEPDADITVLLYLADAPVGELTGSVRDAAGGTVTVQLVSDDRFVAGTVSYDFRVRAAPQL